MVGLRLRGLGQSVSSNGTVASLVNSVGVREGSLVEALDPGGGNVKVDVFDGDRLGDTVLAVTVL